MIPLAPGPGTLGAMNWAWLGGPMVHLVEFVAALITIWLAIWWLARRTIPRHSEVPAVASGSSPGSTERPARTAFVAPTYLDVAAKALAAGWQVKRARHHLAWVSPDGTTRVLAPSTARDGGWLKPFTARLKQAGLDVAA